MSHIWFIATPHILHLLHDNFCTHKTQTRDSSEYLQYALLLFVLQL